MPTAKALRCSHAKRVVYEEQLPSTLLLNQIKNTPFIFLLIILIFRTVYDILSYFKLPGNYIINQILSILMPQSRRKTLLFSS